MNTVLNPSPIFDKRLRTYLRDIISWHGYVRFLGMASFQNNPDIPIDELYVPIRISDSPVSPDTAPNEWDTADPVFRIIEQRRLIILGDPGSGKSTLINWFAWYLASGFSRRLPGGLSDLLPVPIVLRDIKLDGRAGIDGLLDAFLERPVARGLANHRELLDEYLHSGKVLLLIDGLDEVSIENQLAIRRAISDCVSRFPDAYILCTSRIVGYERTADAGKQYRSSTGVSESTHAEHSPDWTQMPVAYVAPFDDYQIAVFSLNWYRDQGGSDSESRLLRDDFVEAIRSDESTLRLARTPNLLTMMALVYRVRARLPNGRALLYEDIAQAYLESIDSARKLKDEFTWQIKKRWLARVGFEMQLRRKAHFAGGLLVDRELVLEWIVDAMRQSGEGERSDYAELYLDWIARRSGLLLPRGEGKFAFLHLSFQEYFAALYIKQQMENPEWFNPESDDATTLDQRVNSERLKTWSGIAHWQPIFVFLFELFSTSPGWTKGLLKYCFPVELASYADGQIDACRSQIRKYCESEGLPPQSNLLIQMLGNPHAGLSRDQRAKYLRIAFEIALFEQSVYDFDFAFDRQYYERTTLLVSILNSSLLTSTALELLGEASEQIAVLVLDDISPTAFGALKTIFFRLQSIRVLSLKGGFIDNLDFLLGDAFRDLRNLILDQIDAKELTPLENLLELEGLILTATNLAEPGPLAKCTSLRKLSLRQVNLADLSIVNDMHRLEDLVLDGMSVLSLNPLAELESLRRLDLEDVVAPDFDAIADLPDLRMLSLQRVNMSNLDPLRKSCNLLSLNLIGTPISDLGPIAELPLLESLNISRTRVTTLRALSKCKLKSLILDGTKVSSLRPIRQNRTLEQLWFNRTNVTNLEPIAEITTLRSLWFDSTGVSDLAPLSNLKQLRDLSMDYTPIRDLSPLSGLTELHTVWINGTYVDRNALQHIERLSILPLAVTD